MFDTGRDTAQLVTSAEQRIDSAVTDAVRRITEAAERAEQPRALPPTGAAPTSLPVPAQK